MTRGHDVGFGDRGIRRLHEDGEAFTPRVACGDRCDSSRHDAGDCGDGQFDLVRHDVAPTDDEEVLAASDQMEILAAQEAQVPCCEPLAAAGREDRLTT